MKKLTNVQQWTVNIAQEYELMQDVIIEKLSQKYKPYTVEDIERYILKGKRIMRHQKKLKTEEVTQQLFGK